jgi:hypothetical protein
MPEHSAQNFYSQNLLREPDVVLAANAALGNGTLQLS